MSKQRHSNRLLHIATLGRAVALDGYMKIHLHTDFTEQFNTDETFFTKDRLPITFDSVNLARGLVRVSGVDRPEQCAKYTNTELYTTYERTRETCVLGENQYFWFDIIGLKVIDDGEELGKVLEIERIGAVDYLLIKEKKEFLLPYHPPFVVDVNINEGTIYTSGAKDLLEAS